MARLNAWQRIERVLPGKPFGDGRDGNINTATIPSLNRKSCSGTSGTDTLNADTDASPYAVGDLLWIRQKRGTGVGQWEINMVEAVGSDQYTLVKNLQYTYTDSGASQAQVTKIPQYNNVTVASGTWTIPAWDGDVGGDFTMAVKKLLTITGTINGDGQGFRGGTGGAASGASTAQSGEGAPADRTTQTGNNGNAGGGSQETVSNNGSYKGGGGGANANSGETGTGSAAGGEVGGTGGTADGSADLTDMPPAGAGGGNAVSNVTSTGDGGDAGADFLIFAKEVDNNGTVTIDGANGTNAMDGASVLSGGGSGAGGNGLWVVEKGDLSNTSTATGGARTEEAGNSGNYGGAGSVGRFAVHHSGTVTGTTSPTFDDTTDGTLRESSGAFFNLL